MGLPRKPAFTILAFAGILLACDLLPMLHDYRVMDWRAVPGLLDFKQRRRSSTPIEDEQVRLRPEVPPRVKPYPITGPHGGLLAFHEALRQLELGARRHVRILHYGDSPVTADLITADTRRLLQERFGNGGHGFCLIAKPWAWYAHYGLEMRAEQWVIDPANQSGVKDGLFGLGGVSFRGWAGSAARLKLNDGAPGRVEVAFLHQPGGGEFSVETPDAVLGAVDTDAPQTFSGFAAFSLPPGNPTLTIRVTKGRVRLFGLQFERATPGVVYHSLGVNGAYVSVLARMFGERHWAEQLRHYKPDLAIVNYGTNESMYPRFVDTASEREMREVVRRLRAALPEVSILLMSPMDRGERKPAGHIGTVPAIPRLVAIQQRVAGDMGCAFFNTFEAMGGEGTMGRWYEAEPRLVGADFIHPMPQGARIVGGLLYRAMIDGYNRYKLRLHQKRLAHAIPPRPPVGYRK